MLASDGSCKGNILVMSNTGSCWILHLGSARAARSRLRTAAGLGSLCVCVCVRMCARDRCLTCLDCIMQCRAAQCEDMNLRSLRRPYKSHIQRIDEMAPWLFSGCLWLLTAEVASFRHKERKLRFVEEELRQIAGPSARFVRFSTESDFLFDKGSRAVDSLRMRCYKRRPASCRGAEVLG